MNLSEHLSLQLVGVQELFPPLPRIITRGLCHHPTYGRGNGAEGTIVTQ